MDTMRYGLVFVLIISCLSFADTTKRLILKDGSFQSVQKYEIKGSNVRYLSAERYEWEDIPSSMIDWPATEKYQKELDRKTAEATAIPDKESVAKSAAEAEVEAHTPEVTTNLRLPDKVGVYVLDEHHDTPRLLELTQTSTHVVAHVTQYLILHKVNPIASKEETTELTAAHAKVQFHGSRPVFFIRPELEVEGAKRGEIPRLTSGDAYHYQILKVVPKRDTRLVATTKIDFAGDSSLDYSIVPTASEVMSGGMWIKLEPKQELIPGEYVLLETISEERLSTYVWDFGVDSGIPENPNSRVAAKKRK